MSKPTFSISFSEFSNFRQCPHKWFLNYMLKIPDTSNEELIFGSMVHDTIERMLTDKVLGKMSRDIVVVESMLKRELRNQIMSIKDLTFLKKMNEGWVAPTFMKQGKGLLKELDVHNRFLKEYDLIDVEIKLDGLPIIDRPDVTLVYKGFIDMVLRHKKTGRYLILDWKTSRKKWDISKKEEDSYFYAQLKLYKHYYSMMKGIPIDQIDLCFYNLPRDEPEFQKQYNKVLDKEDIDLFMLEFVETCQKLYDFNHFLLDKARFMTKKNFCSRCSYNVPHLCNDLEQHQVVELKEVKF